MAEQTTTTTQKPTAKTRRTPGYAVTIKTFIVTDASNFEQQQKVLDAMKALHSTPPNIAPILALVDPAHTTFLSKAEARVL